MTYLQPVHFLLNLRSWKLSSPFVIIQPKSYGKKKKEYLLYLHSTTKHAEGKKKTIKGKEKTYVHVLEKDQFGK